MKIRCSSAPMIAACPASYMMTAKAVSECGAKPANEAMQRGTEIHAILSKGVDEFGLKWLAQAKDDLTLDIAVRILAMRAWRTITTLEMQNADCFYTEQFLPTEGGAMCLPNRLRFVGSADLIVCDSKRNTILVMDYKSGMAAQEPSYEHPQLVAYAVLAYFSASTLLNDKLMDQNKAVTVYGQIIPAVGKMGAPLRVDPENGADAIRQLIELCEDADDMTLEPTPGPHCGWCFAAGRTCHAFKATVSEALVAHDRSLPMVPDESLAEAYSMLKRLTCLQDSLADELKRRITATGKPCGGYGMKLRRGTVKLEGNALLEACAEWGITATDLGISVNIKEVGEIVAKKLNVKKADGVSLVEMKYGQKAVHNEGVMILEAVDEEDK